MSSLLPEKKLSFSPQLAATLGLEEAIMLTVVGELYAHQHSERQQGFDWLTIDGQRIQQLLPFWNELDIRRVLQSLESLGVLLINSAPFQVNASIRFALNESTADPQTPAKQHTPVQSAPQSNYQPQHNTAATQQKAQLVGNQWSPREETLRWLEQMNNIPRDFALSELFPFLTYHRDKGIPNHSWDHKFQSWVIRSFQDKNQREARSSNNPNIQMHSQWQPDEDAVDLLVRGGMDKTFIEEVLPEFILIWREKGESRNDWNRQFVQYIRQQWLYFSSKQPEPINKNWQPSMDCLEILDMSNIDRTFALSFLPEFVLYWRNTEQAVRSWDSKFLQFIRKKWAERLVMTNGNEQQGGQTRSGQATSFIDQHTDSSWAEDV